jgi:hypothetical protein
MVREEDGQRLLRLERSEESGAGKAVNMSLNRWAIESRIGSLPKQSGRSRTILAENSAWTSSRLHDEISGQGLKTIEEIVGRALFY